MSQLISAYFGYYWTSLLILDFMEFMATFNFTWLIKESLPHPRLLGISWLSHDIMAHLGLAILLHFNASFGNSWLIQDFIVPSRFGWISWLSGFLSFGVSWLIWEFFLFICNFLAHFGILCDFLHQQFHTRFHGPVRISCSFSFTWHIYVFMVCLVSSLSISLLI